MTLGEIIAIIVSVLIIGGAVLYIIKAKKSGKKCIGCPDGASCTSCRSCNGACCGCGKSEQDSEKTEQ